MDFLKQLGIDDTNYGACSGPHEWSKTTDAGRNDSANPSTGEIIASVYHCSENDYEKLVMRSVETFNEWRQVPAPKRGELVRKIANALREKKDFLGSLVALEMGKIKQEGDGEVQEMIDIADFAVGLSRQLYGLTMHSERALHRMYEQWHPLGPVGVITAFNFPVAVWSWNAFIAAVCGDTVVWKPSSNVPLCAIAVQNILNDVMESSPYPPVFSLIIGKGSTVGERLVRDSRVPLISFTGSTVMGKKIGGIVGERLGRTILELGGNNAIIVDESADLEAAIPAIVFGAIGTAGQRCTSTRRVFVRKEMFQNVAETIIEAYRQVKIGDPLDGETLMGPVVDEGAIKVYAEALKRIKKEGGEILYGGKVLNGPGFHVEPTLVKAKNDFPVVQEETFAPILYLIEYDDLEDAIQQHNDVPQGLSSSIFTTDLRNAEKFLSHGGSDCGIANVNVGTSGAEIGGAFGGEKETGGGRESGSDAWKSYMRRQTNTINWGGRMSLAQGIRFGDFSD
ncbi:MAG: aldehyde dehydrogenase family protein [Candidatus Neomarinimicrobiota bacterium]